MPPYTGRKEKKKKIGCEKAAHGKKKILVFLFVCVRFILMCMCVEKTTITTTTVLLIPLSSSSSLTPPSPPPPPDSALNHVIIQRFATSFTSTKSGMFNPIAFYVSVGLGVVSLLKKKNQLFCHRKKKLNCI